MAIIAKNGLSRNTIIDAQKIMILTMFRNGISIATFFPILFRAKPLIKIP